MNLNADFPYKIQNSSMILPMPTVADIQVTRGCISHLDYGLKNFSIKCLILDTTGEFQLSSVNFGFMMTLSKFCQDNKIEMKLVCNKQKVLDMFDLLKIRHIFKVYPTLEEALI
jgi:anti-anti-sigma factor